MFTRIKSGDIEINKIIALAIERGLVIGLESLGNNSRLMYPEAVRVLVSHHIYYCLCQTEVNTNFIFHQLSFYLITMNLETQQPQ